MYENVGIRSAVIDGKFLPDERLWELLIRAGVKVTVVTDDPDAMRPVIDSLVNDSAKVGIRDHAPADDGAFVVCDAESLEALRRRFGEE
jgi:hypothetical protein